MSPRKLSFGDFQPGGNTGFDSLIGVLVLGVDSPPPSRYLGIVGLAPERYQLIGCGLSTEVVETNLKARVPPMRKFYALLHHGVLSTTLTQLVQCWSSCRSVFWQDYHLVLLKFTWPSFSLPSSLLNLFGEVSSCVSSFLESFHSPGRLIRGSV